MKPKDKNLKKIFEKAGKKEADRRPDELKEKEKKSK